MFIFVHICVSTTELSLDRLFTNQYMTVFKWIRAQKKILQWILVVTFCSLKYMRPCLTGDCMDNFADKLVLQTVYGLNKF